MQNSADDDAPFGAYGLVVRGLPGARSWMQPQPPDAPLFVLTVEHRPTSEPPVASKLTATAAVVPLIGGGHLVMEHGTPAAHFSLPARPSDAELLHPYLAPAAALHWQWTGREALHAGAFMVERGAILLMGAKEDGKSTTLGALARAGVPIVTDDLAIIERGRVLAGPRSIDLRPAGDGATLDAGVIGTSVRDGQRHRVTLPPVPDLVPVVGLAHLEWSTSIALTSLEVSDRFSRLSAQRTFPQLDADPIALLDLAALPTIIAARPRDLYGLDAFCDALTRYFD